MVKDFKRWPRRAEEPTSAASGQSESLPERCFPRQLSEHADRMPPRDSYTKRLSRPYVPYSPESGTGPPGRDGGLRCSAGFCSRVVMVCPARQASLLN